MNTHQNKHISDKMKIKYRNILASQQTLNNTQHTKGLQEIKDK